MSSRSGKTAFYKRSVSGVTKLHRPIILVVLEGLCHIVVYIQHKGVSHCRIKNISFVMSRVGKTDILKIMITHTDRKPRLQNRVLAFLSPTFF